MQCQLFETTTAVSTTAIVIFDSEAYGLDVANAVFMGMTIANLGAGEIHFKVDIKVHPSGTWITHTAMNGSVARDYSNISNSFYRLGNTVIASALGNTTAAISANLKFVYAFRILAIAISGGSRSVRVRGNIKIARDFNYEELSVQQVAAGTVSPSSAFTFTDVSKHAYMSLYLIAGGTNAIQDIPFNQSPGGSSFTSYGELLAFSFYPGDTYIRFSNPNANSAFGGDKNSQIIEASLITSTQRNSTHRFNVDAAYEIGFLFNIPGGSVIDYYVSLNG